MPETPKTDPDATIEYLSLKSSAPDYAAKTSKQTITLRWAAIVGAAIVIVAFAAMELFLLLHLFSSQNPSGHLVLLAISPIVGTTVIVVFILVGVFRGHKDPQISGPPPAAVASAAFGTEL